MRSKQLGFVLSSMLLGAAACMVAADAPATPPAPATQPAARNDLLGAEYSNETYGLAFCPPLDCVEIHKAAPNHIVEFDQAKNGWIVVARQLLMEKPMPLTAEKDQFGNTNARGGLLEETIKNISQNTPGAEIIGADNGPEIINVGVVRVGLIYVRYTNAADERKLLQEAVVEVPDAKSRLYYFVDFVSKAQPKDAPADPIDPGEAQAHDVFMQLLDSIKLLDRTKIVEDQRDRLNATHALFVNWMSRNGEPIKKALVPAQWLRIVRDGKDVGYSYNTEIVADTIESAGKTVPIKDPGEYEVRISVRSRMIPSVGVQWDTGSWQRFTVNRKEENWVSVAKATNTKREVTTELQQFGSSHEYVKTVSIKGPIDPNKPWPPPLGGHAIGDTGPMGWGPNIDSRTVRTLTVNTIDGDPFTQDVPIFYIPQGVSNILPRLLPLNEPKKYMFGTFVATPTGQVATKGGGKVMSRYVDVLSRQDVQFNGRTIDAIPVTDHIGLSGPVTTTYLSPDGKFLGSICKYSDGKEKDGTEKMTILTIMPTDMETLQRIWPNTELSAPEQAPTAPGMAAPIH